MTRVLIVNGEEYDLEDSKLVVTVGLDEVRVEVAKASMSASEQERILDEVVGQDATPAEEAPKEQKFASAKPVDGPVHAAVLPYDAAAKKQPRTLTEAELKSLNSTRRDLEVSVVRRDAVEAKGYSNLKKSVLLKSDPIAALTDDHLLKGILTLVRAEQQAVRTDRKENFLLLESQPVLVFDEVKDEITGEGAFHFEEVVSVFENPDNLLSKPDAAGGGPKK